MKLALEYLDAAVVLLAISLLAALSRATGAPVFESYLEGRLTLLTIFGLPLVAIYVAVRTRGFAPARFIVDWLPLLGLVAAYESLKHLHADRITMWLGIAPKDGVMLHIDELLFGRALPLRLQWTAVPWFTNVMWFAYVWIYYSAPLIALGGAYAKDRVLFLRLRRALLVGLLGGYVSYLLIPVAGPLFTVGEQFRVPILTQPELQRLTFDTLRYNWDCFPSLHTAVPWFLLLVAWPSLRAWSRAVGVVACTAVTLSTVTLRFHYGIDVIAGLCWALLVWRVALLTTPAPAPSPAYSSASSAFQ